MSTEAGWVLYTMLIKDKHIPGSLKTVQKHYTCSNKKYIIYIHHSAHIYARLNGMTYYYLRHHTVYEYD